MTPIRSIVLALILATASLPAFSAALGVRSIRVVLTPAGNIDLRHLDGNDGSGTPPVAPTLGTPTATSSTTASIPLLATCSGGTAPYVYEVQLSTTNGATGFTVFSASANFSVDNTYSATGLTASTQYWVRVACTDNAALRSVASNVDTFTTQATPGGGDVTAPTNPTVVNITSTVPGQVVLTCSGATDNVAIDHYDISGGTGDGAGHAVASRGVIAQPTTCAFTESGLVEGDEYYYRVRTYDTSGNSQSSGTAQQFVTIAETPGGPPTGDGDVFNEGFESATWYQNNGWGAATSGNMSNTLNPSSNNNYLTRVCANENGVTLRNGCAVRIRFNTNTNTGTNMAVRIVDEVGHTTPLGGTLWYRYYMAFGANFKPTNDPGYLTKLPGFSAATDGRTDECGSGGNICTGPGSNPGGDVCTTGAGTCGWSARQQAAEQNANCASTGRVPLGIYPYYSNDPTPEGHTVHYSGYTINSGCTQGVQRTQWFCVKGRLKLNNPGGTANGEHQIFINDVSVYNASGILFTANSNPLNSVYLWWGNQFTGGGGAGNGGVPRGFMLQTSDDYIDDLAISTTDPGC